MTCWKKSDVTTDLIIVGYTWPKNFWTPYILPTASILFIFIFFNKREMYYYLHTDNEIEHYTENYLLKKIIDPYKYISYKYRVFFSLSWTK